MRLRLGSLLIVTSAVVALSTIIACGSQSTAGRRSAPLDQEPEPTEPQEEEEPAPTQSTTPGNKTDDTCLGKASLAFDNVKCNACMSNKASCCQATIACFKDNPQCTALHACMLKCEPPKPPPTTDGGAGDGGASAAAMAIFTTEVYPSVNATCGTCHSAGTGGAPIFFSAGGGGGGGGGGQAAATYTLFKQRGFHLPGSIFVNKGLHTGPALTAAQRGLVDKWVAAETAAAPPPPPTTGVDAGGQAACKDACKAQYPATGVIIAQWSAYNTCAAVTCKADCL